jgi:hypothetical protein
MRLVLYTLIFAALAAAEGNGEGKGCSNATLKGRYGFVISGTKPSGPPPAPLENMIGTAVTTFDGHGNLTQIDNIHSSISPLILDRPGTGTYSIRDDCSGTMALNNPGSPTLEARIVVVDKGREVRVVVMAPATVMVTSNGRKL